MGKTVVSHTFCVDGHELTAQEWKDERCLTVSIHMNNRAFLIKNLREDQGKNLIIEIQRQLGIKVTGVGGPFVVEEGGNITGKELVFYLP